MLEHVVSDAVLLSMEILHRSSTQGHREGMSGLCLRIIMKVTSDNPNRVSISSVIGHPSNARREV